nr:hypothetical protein BaRGS_012313 [Batillaria attramentaria]
MLNYVLKLKANPAFNCVFHPVYEDLYDVHKNEPKPLSLRVRPLLQAAGVDINSVEETLFPATPPWTLPTPEVRLDLTAHKKDSTPDPIYFHGLQQILADFPGFRQIFTDGSKSEDGRVGAAAVMDGRVFTRRLADGSSVYSAELRAILLALRHVYQSVECNFLILTDSLSALQALHGRRLDHPLLVLIHELHASLIADNKDRSQVMWASEETGALTGLRMLPAMALWRMSAWPVVILNL